jgi:hypothetical protein
MDDIVNRMNEVAADLGRANEELAVANAIHVDVRAGCSGIRSYGASGAFGPKCTSAMRIPTVVPRPPPVTRSQFRPSTLVQSHLRPSTSVQSQFRPAAPSQGGSAGTRASSASTAAAIAAPTQPPRVRNPGSSQQGAAFYARLCIQYDAQNHLYNSCADAIEVDSGRNCDQEPLSRVTCWVRVEPGSVAPDGFSMVLFASSHRPTR